jgi:hypothetical protein
MNHLDFCKRLIDDVADRPLAADRWREVYSVVELLSLPISGRPATISECEAAMPQACLRPLVSLGLLDVRLGGLLVWLDGETRLTAGQGHCWSDGLEPEFERLWQAYRPGKPDDRNNQRRMSKGPKAPARRQYLKIVKTPDMAAEILAAVQRASAANWPQYNGYSPHVRTYLHQRAWEGEADEVVPVAPTTGPQEKRRQQLLSLVRQGNLSRAEAESQFGGPLGD